MGLPSGLEDDSDNPWRIPETVEVGQPVEILVLAGFYHSDMMQVPFECVLLEEGWHRIEPPQKIFFRVVGWRYVMRATAKEDEMSSATAIVVRGIYRNKSGVLYQIVSCPKHPLTYQANVVYERLPDLTQFVLPINEFFGLGYKQVGLADFKELKSDG